MNNNFYKIEEDTFNDPNLDYANVIYIKYRHKRREQYR